MLMRIVNIIYSLCAERNALFCTNSYVLRTIFSFCGKLLSPGNEGLQITLPRSAGRSFNQTFVGYKGEGGRLARRRVERDLSQAGASLTTIRPFDEPWRN